MKRRLCTLAFGAFLGSVVTLAVVLWLQRGMGHAVAEGGGAGTPSGNGDVNGDGKIDISDGVYVLSWLFTGGPAPVPIDCQPPVGRGLPATGQEMSFVVGDDGFYRFGCPVAGRFMDNGDGTVTDTCTGLMWQRDPTPDLYNWGDAVRYCEGLDFAGHADWRLPNVLELQSIVDHGRADPSIYPVFGTTSDWYWSSSASYGLGAGPSGTWAVDFNSGLLGLHDTKDMPQVHLVRAVRSVPIECPPPVVKGLPATGQTECYGVVEGQGWVAVPCEGAEIPGQDGAYQAGCPMEGRFVDNEDGTVTDNCTGLMWQKDTADVNGDGTVNQDWEGGDRLALSEALKHCEDLDLAGHTDWRLPNVRELQSIVDYGRIGPAIDPAFGAVLDSYWSSSSYLGYNPGYNAWMVEFSFGFLEHPNFDGPNSYFVRAVRNAQ